jgi:hypothetical protein
LLNEQIILLMSVNSSAVFQAAAAAPADRPSEGIPNHWHVVMVRVTTSEFRDSWQRPEGKRLRRVAVETPVTYQVQELRQVDGNMD